MIIPVFNCLRICFLMQIPVNQVINAELEHLVRYVIWVELASIVSK